MRTPVIYSTMLRFILAWGREDGLGRKTSSGILGGKTAQLSQRAEGASEEMISAFATR